MERMQITFVVLNLISVAIYVVGDAVAYFPTEARAMNHFQFQPFSQLHPVNRNAMHQGFMLTRESIVPQGPMLTHEVMIPQERMDPQDHVQPILHTSVASPLAPPLVPERPSEGLNYTGTLRLTDEDDFRAAKGSYDYPAHSSGTYPPASSYGYGQQAPSYGPSASAPNYSSPAPASHYSPPAAGPASSSYSPPSPGHQPPTNKFSLLKPDLTSIIKPVTAKVAGKVSGLIGLVLSLLTGTAGDDLEMKGFKDIVINGIVKPLLIAKGGIKSLISKLTIPVISLLLINLEVLITVWWLWEECPEVKPSYDYTKPSYTPSYNSYR